MRSSSEVVPYFVIGILYQLRGQDRSDPLR